MSIITALVLFALPPILTNTYLGVSEVDPAAVDAARGMGMNGPQVLAQGRAADGHVRCSWAGCGWPPSR